MTRATIKRRIRAELSRLRVAARQPIVIAALRHPESKSLLRLAGIAPDVAGARRVEVGSGALPRPGYIHVDYDGSLPDLQLRAGADHLPVPADWATEVLAIHVLEHMPPPLLASTLNEWRRVLKPGGVLEVHVPNGLAIARQLAETTDTDQFWRLQNAIFGYWVGPDTTEPTDFLAAPDHKTLFTPSLLTEALLDSGFRDVEDVSGTIECRHQTGWSATIPGLCLEFTARK